MKVKHTPKTAIIGCGNTNRSDDGVGPYVIQLLQQYDLPESVVCYDAGTDGMGVMYQARGVDKLIVIDASKPENSPGTIYQVPGDELSIPHEQSYNLHDFRWDHALYVGKKIYADNFPKQVTVFLIEAQSLQLGLELSDSVIDSAESVALKIHALVSQSEK